jgi:tRNA-Thr(GGU) m(6)t(6)A37 methyltransferase TsaA
MNVMPIGVARTPYRVPDDCPSQPDPDGPEVRIEIDELYRDGLLGLARHDRVDVLMWFDGARRDLMHQHSTPHPEWGVMGVFGLRSPHRPNPIGVSEVELLRVEAAAIVVRGLDCVDGTPVIDIKPAL